jgi:thaumarchaeosortase
LSDKLLQNKSLIAGILLISSPILFALAVFPDSFSLSWNQGRGGFLFALAFIVAELVGLKLKISTKRLLTIIPLAALTIAYLIGLEYGLRDYIQGGSEVYDVQLIFSWTWMWDFIVMTSFVVSTLFIFFGKRWIRISPAGPIFLGGSAVILSLDAFFPYDTLGPLQYVVPYLVQTNAWIITTFDLGVATARDNLMFLRGDHGPFALQVFWPSAGVHSVIIYSLVMMAFLLKMNIQRNRKAMYFVIGILGTIGVNMIRIFSLSLFALKVSTNAAEFEEYHSVAGEIMFLPWLFIFLLVVTAIETKRMKKLQAAQSENKPS